MHWTLDPDHPFAGIGEKLKRADQNIFNLHNEILAFFASGKYPVLPQPDDKEWQDAVDYHKNLVIPIRFSVLAGEAVHHLRSCFDHVVWFFSNSAYRAKHENAIEFPVICTPPDRDRLKRLERQIGGVDKSGVRDLITGLQPYHLGADAADDPLCIIHDMDRFDKHRELVLVTSRANLTFPTMPDSLKNLINAYAQAKPISTSDVMAFQKAAKHNAKVTPQVGFAHFGNRRGELLIPALVKLFNATERIVSLFVREI